jgi:hypothetical protein
MNFKPITDTLKGRYDKENEHHNSRFASENYWYIRRIHLKDTGEVDTLASLPIHCEGQQASVVSATYYPIWGAKGYEDYLIVSIRVYMMFKGYFRAVAESTKEHTFTEQFMASITAHEPEWDTYYQQANFFLDSIPQRYGTASFRIYQRGSNVLPKMD